MLTRKPRRRRAAIPAVWKLQDAKARFSELVRRARARGPQRVTVHGKEVAVLVSAEDFARLSGPAGSGQALVEAFRDPRVGEDLLIEPVSLRLPASAPVSFGRAPR